MPAFRAEIACDLVVSLHEVAKDVLPEDLHNWLIATVHAAQTQDNDTDCVRGLVPAVLQTSSDDLQRSSESLVA
ncbi:hypothetical protein KSP40_PGU003234 [Platanthera guangdongensis]|uniref:Uncharacterized protein n=1 Tax=Platanthera guangdongensis TaxID=2320717 RepID=A0ABR2MLA7_9ASPA